MLSFYLYLYYYVKQILYPFLETEEHEDNHSSSLYGEGMQ